MLQKLKTYLYLKRTGNRLPATGNFLAIVLILSNISCTLAQEIDNNGAFEFWSRVNIRHTTKKGLQHDVEFQFRNQQRVASLQERFTLYTFRWYIMKRFTNFYLQTSPVTFFERSAANGTWVSEYRVTQNAGWYFLKDNLQLRVGAEGRFFMSQPSNFEELRLRARVFYQHPLSPRLSFVSANELFIHRRLSGRAVPWFDQNRLLAGIRIKANRTLTVEPGYQYHVRSFEKGHTDNFHVFHLYLNYTI